MQTAQGGEFVSPSGNISCEVDYNRDGVMAAYCETGTPPQSVTMGVTGTYTTCTGELCLSNPGMDTPTLAYGAATGAGPFVCESATTGVTCRSRRQGLPDLSLRHHAGVMPIHGPTGPSLDRVGVANSEVAAAAQRSQHGHQSPPTGPHSATSREPGHSPARHSS